MLALKGIKEEDYQSIIIKMVEDYYITSYGKENADYLLPVEWKDVINNVPFIGPEGKLYTSVTVDSIEVTTSLIMNITDGNRETPWIDKLAEETRKTAVNGISIEEAQLVGGEEGKENQGESQKELSDEEIFALFEGNYVFASGAGGWTTTMTINSDGSFEGLFHDSNAIVGEPYDKEFPDAKGEMYISEFKGSLEIVEKVDEHVWAVLVKDVTLTYQIDEAWSEGEIVYIPTEPYGIEDNSIYYLIEPGGDKKYFDKDMAGTFLYGVTGITLDSIDVAPTYLFVNEEGLLFAKSQW